MSLFSILSYVLISTFTPGPSNISTASMAILHGYKNTLKYQLGLALGVFILMALNGLFSAVLLQHFPSLESILHYVGAAYILYLAFSILKASYSFVEQETKPLGITHGFILQILNPKLLVYAFTLFTGFLTSIPKTIISLTVIPILLTIISFCATSTWALFGNVIKTHLHNPRLRTAVNVILFILLVYTAVSLIMFS